MNTFDQSLIAKIVLLDPGQSDQRRLTVPFDGRTYHVIECTDETQAVSIVRSEDVDVFSFTAGEAGESPEVIIRRLREAAPSVEVIVAVPPDCGADPVEIITAGAFDCISAPPSTEQLLARASRAVEHRRMKLERTHLGEHVAMHCGFDNLVGISQPIVELRETITRLAPTDIPVVFVGEPGVGRELSAHILHYHSNRRTGPLVILDPVTAEPLLVPERFRYRDKLGGPGVLERADGGTVILREIEKMPETVQDNLAEFLRDFTITSSDGESRRLNIRFAATSTLDPDSDEFTNRVSRRLVMRMNLFTIRIPTLHERREDIELLTEYFLRHIAFESQHSQPTISRAAVERLVRYGWPGNVRELKNTLRRASALAGKARLEADDIVFVTSDRGDSTVSREVHMQRGTTGLRLADNQRDLIETALDENDWNFTQTARELGIGRTTLWRKVKKYNLKREEVTA